MSLPRGPDRDLERLLGDDRGEFGALYRKLSRSEPPRRLDRAVLGEAARAVRGRAPRRHRWLVGIGSAAGIVLAAGIAWRVGQEAAMQPSAVITPAHAPVEVVPVQPISERTRRQQPAPPMDALADDAAVMDAVPASKKREAPAGARQDARPAPRKPVAAPPPPPAPAVQPARPEPAPFPQAKESAVAGEADGSAAVAPDRAASDEATFTGGQGSARDRLRARAAPAPSASVELRRDQQLAPDAWLAQVRDLLRQGRRQQAAESLRLFHRMHPSHDIPEDLRSLLE